MNVNAIAPWEVIKRMREKLEEQAEQIERLNATVEELKKVIENVEQSTVDNADI